MKFLAFALLMMPVFASAQNVPNKEPVQFAKTINIPDISVYKTVQVIERDPDKTFLTLTIGETQFFDVGIYYQDSYAIGTANRISQGRLYQALKINTKKGVYAVTAVNHQRTAIRVFLLVVYEEKIEVRPVDKLTKGKEKGFEFDRIKKGSRS